MITVEHVTKRYGATLAVDDVSFRVERGEVVGFLGPNGAGKSTVLRMLSTWLTPDSGTITVAGHDTRREPLGVRRSLGYLPEHNALYETMRVDRFLAFVGRMHGLDGARLADRAGWVVEACQLESVLAKKIQHCSKGFRQRVGVAAALIHDPAVVLLDEPTHGLDPLQVALFLEFVRALASNHAVLFSTHVLSEAAAVADRLLVIHAGRLLLDAPVAEMRARAGAAGRTLEAELLELVRAARRGEREPGMSARASSERLGAGLFARGVRLVAARELGAAFDAGIATIATIVFTLLANSIFMNEFFLTGTLDMRAFFDLEPLLLAFFLPALSMRLWAEERKSRTIELLFTLPIRPLQAVLGKYLAALALFGLFLACTLPIPILLEVLGNPDRGAILAGYLGLVGLGGLFLALGGLCSALARDQIVAFVASTLCGFTLVLTGEERVASVLDGLAPSLGVGSFLREHVSVLPPYGEFVRGVVRLSAVGYFALLAALALWATALVLERDRS